MAVVTSHISSVLLFHACCCRKDNCASNANTLCIAPTFMYLFVWISDCYSKHSIANDPTCDTGGYYYSGDGRFFIGRLPSLSSWGTGHSL